jgi:hypothetical protein
MITLDRDVRSAHPDFAWGPTRNPSNQGWGKWEISLGTAAWPVYFNPKELTIDRSVPWEKYK